jgi:hypothetical protein
MYWLFSAHTRDSICRSCDVRKSPVFLIIARGFLMTFLMYCTCGIRGGQGSAVSISIRIPRPAGDARVAAGYTYAAARAAGYTYDNVTRTGLKNGSYTVKYQYLYC